MKSHEQHMKEWLRHLVSMRDCWEWRQRDWLYCKDKKSGRLFSPVYVGLTNAIQKYLWHKSRWEYNHG